MILLSTIVIALQLKERPKSQKSLHLSDDLWGDYLVSVYISK